MSNSLPPASSLLPPSCTRPFLPPRAIGSLEDAKQHPSSICSHFYGARYDPLEMYLHLRRFWPSLRWRARRHLMSLRFGIILIRILFQIERWNVQLSMRRRRARRGIYRWKLVDILRRRWDIEFVFHFRSTFLDIQHTQYSGIGGSLDERHEDGSGGAVFRRDQYGSSRIDECGSGSKCESDWSRYAD